MRIAIFVTTLLLLSAAAAAAPPGIAQRAATPGPTPMSWNQWVSLFRDYMELIDHFSKVVEDSSNAGVAAVIYTDDILRTRPSREAIEYYQKLLPEVKDPAVRRAIHLRLAEHLRLSNQADAALAQLRELIIAAPASTPPPTSQPAASR